MKVSRGLLRRWIKRSAGGAENLAVKWALSVSSQTSAFSHSGDRRLYAVFPSAFLFPGYFAALRRFNRGLREKKNGAELSGMSTIVGGTAKGLCPLVRHCLMVHAPFAIAKRLGCVASPLRGSV